MNKDKQQNSIPFPSIKADKLLLFNPYIQATIQQWIFRQAWGELGQPHQCLLPWAHTKSHTKKNPQGQKMRC